LPLEVKRKNTQCL